MILTTLPKNSFKSSALPFKDELLFTNKTSVFPFDLYDIIILKIKSSVSFDLSKIKLL